MSILGATGLKVSPIGLGLAAVGRPDYINLGHAKDLRNHSVDAMESHAYELPTWRDHTGSLNVFLVRGSNDERLNLKM